jgi:hypothetical protein
MQQFPSKPFTNLWNKHANMTSAPRGATRLACEHDDISILTKQIEKATLSASTENIQTALQTCGLGSQRLN